MKLLVKDGVIYERYVTGIKAPNKGPCGVLYTVDHKKLANSGPLVSPRAKCCPLPTKNCCPDAMSDCRVQNIIEALNLC